MAAPRGRGFALRTESPQLQALRRPGDIGLVQRYGNTIEKEVPQSVEDKVIALCDKISQIDPTKSKNEFETLSSSIKSLCGTVESLEKCVNTIISFSLKSKWNAHVCAIICNDLGDVVADDMKFRTLLLRKFQANYNDRNKMYLDQEKFLMGVTFLCEIFYHMEIDGSCLKILTSPIIEYFGMLVDGGSQKEIEVFIEQFPKCYKNLKENNASGLDLLLVKLRKQIVCETSTVMVKAMLLEMFELVLTDWKEQSQNVKNLYEFLSKPIVRICV